MSARTELDFKGFALLTRKLLDPKITSHYPDMELYPVACDPLDNTSIYKRLDEDSEDSDGEGGLGNVSRAIMRPPGHSGKAKKGHLCFDASFETGNLGRVDLVNDFEYDLFLRPDTCNPRFRFWFNFTVENVKQDQRVIFNIVNLSKCRTLLNEGMTPLVKSSNRQKWQRIPKRYVFYHRSPYHRGNYILSFAFGFDEDEVFQFALTAPYSYSKLQSYLVNLESRLPKHEEFFRRELLAESILKRRLDLITIGQKSKSHEKKSVIAVMARVHPSETPASFVCQGLIEILVSSHPLANILRKHVVFKIVPMLNPDGVFVGNFQSSYMGFDLNRSWHLASQWCHPTIKAVLDLLINIDQNDNFQLDLVLDLHANTSLKGCFIYGNSYDDVYRFERHIVFPKILASLCDDYVSSNTIFNSDINKIGTARRYLCSVLNERVNCYTFEVSIHGYNIKGTDVLKPYTEESYMRCGRNLARSFLEYYRASGLIPLYIPTQIKNKRRKNTKRFQQKTNEKANSIREIYRSTILKCTDLQLHYESETSVEDSYDLKEFFKCKKKINKITEKHSCERTPSPVHQPTSPILICMPQPSLSIIDFNSIVRDGFTKKK